MPQATEPGGIGRATLTPPVVPGGTKWECLSIWSCSGWGLPSFQCHHWNWCALTAPFHPYHGTACGPAAGRMATGNVWPWCTLAGRFVFCGTFLRVTPTGRYPAPCSMEPGLSSPCRVAKSDHLIPFVLNWSRQFGRTMSRAQPPDAALRQAKVTRGGNVDR